MSGHKHPYWVLMNTRGEVQSIPSEMEEVFSHTAEWSKLTVQAIKPKPEKVKDDYDSQTQSDEEVMIVLSTINEFD